MLRRIVAFAVLIAWAPSAALAANLGIIHGSLHDESHQPVAGAQLILLDAHDHVVDRHLTDAQGHFDLEQVPFGDYRLVFIAPDGRRAEHGLRIASGELLSVDEVIGSAPSEEILVKARAPRAPPPPTTASSTSTLSHRDIQQLPRGDTSSVNEILATQPGFVFDAMGNLFARGNHANIQYQLDGVPLPDSVSGLFGGFLSPKMLENMEVLTGGLGAEYGERLAAVVNLNAKKPTEDGEGQAELQYGEFQTVSPSAAYGKKWGNLSVLAGGSLRWTDRALDPPAFSPIVHDRGNEQRAFVRVDEELNDRDHLSALATVAHNFYQVPLDPTAVPYDPSQPNGGRMPDAYGNPPAAYFPLDTHSTEDEWDVFALASYRHDYGPKSSLRLSGSYRNSRGTFFADAAHALGPTADPCSTDAFGNTSCTSASDVGRSAQHFALDAEYLRGFGDHHVFKLGGRVDQLLGQTQYTSYTRNDALQGPDPALTLSGTDNARASTGGLYAEDVASLGRWSINAGLRFDFQKVLFVQGTDAPLQTGWGPRLGVAYRATPNVVAHAFAGLMWMPPPVLDTPAAARQLGVVPPGQAVPYDLLPEQDRYAEVGVSARLLPQLTASFNAWGKLSVNQLDDVEVGNTNVVSPYNFQQGRAGGLELSLVAVLSRRLNAFGNVSLENAQGRGIATAQYLFSPGDLANPGWQLLDHVQTWTANAGGALHEGSSQLSGLMEYGSGLRTGPLNNEHVPGHVRFDVTLAHRFDDVPGKPNLAFDCINLFDAQYAYRIGNGFNGSHWAAGRSFYLRLSKEL